MTDPTGEPPIAIGLFERVRQYARQLTKQGLSRKSALRRNATIVVFCQTFFQQFFEHAFQHEITSVDRDAMLEAARLRIESEHTAKPEAVALVRSFEDLCAIWPDVLGFTYGGLSNEFRRFHTVYIPKLLERAAAWATAGEHRDVATAAADALNEWRKVAKRL